MKSYDDPTLFRPYPELVEPKAHEKPYRIRDSSSEPGLPSRGAVDQKQRRMWVPLAGDGRPVSRHEIGHACFSPTCLPKVSFEPGVLAAVEDARVNLALRRSGIPSDLDFEGEAHVVMLAARDVKAGDAFTLFQRAVASIGTSVGPVIGTILAREETPHGGVIAGWVARVERTLAEAANRSGRVEASFEVGLALARALAHELRAYGLLDAAGRARTRSVVECCLGRGDGDGLVGEGDERRGKRDDTERGAGEAIEAGKLTIRSVPLAVALRARGGARAWRAGVEGSEIRYFHRFASDRAIFRRRWRCPGCTVLIDVSGSMAFGAEDLDRFLLVSPIGTRVAIYGGDGAVGELRIVAEGGRRAALEHLSRIGRGNIVDLPALEWLARQRGPRLWVSDGAVTGVGDRPCAALTARCHAVRRRSGIRRVGALAEAHKVLKVA